jgi:hypothetical protein
MSEPTRIDELLDTLSKVLLRCWIFGFAILLVWLGVVLFASDHVAQFHGRLFGVTKHELEVILYCAIGLLKQLVVVFFFLPWLSIRLVLRGRKA